MQQYVSTSLAFVYYFALWCSLDSTYWAAALSHMAERCLKNRTTEFSKNGRNFVASMISQRCTVAYAASFYETIAHSTISVTFPFICLYAFFVPHGFPWCIQLLNTISVSCPQWDAHYNSWPCCRAQAVWIQISVSQICARLTDFCGVEKKVHRVYEKRPHVKHLNVRFSP